MPIIAIVVLLYLLCQFALIVALPFILLLVIHAVLGADAAIKRQFKVLVAEIVLGYLIVAILWWRVLGDEGYLYEGWRIPVQTYALMLALIIGEFSLSRTLTRFWKDESIRLCCVCLMLCYLGGLLKVESQHSYVAFSPLRQLSVFPAPDFQYEVIRFADGRRRDILGFRKKGASKSIWLNDGCEGIRFNGWKDNQRLGFQIVGYPKETIVTVQNPRLQCGLD